MDAEKFDLERKEFTIAEAIEGTINDALAALPKPCNIVGVKVQFAYETPEGKPEGILEACGSTVSKGGYDPKAIAQLFAKHADDSYPERCLDGVHLGPAPGWRGQDHPAGHAAGARLPSGAD